MPHIKDSSGVTQRSRAYEALRRALILRQIPEGRRLRESEWAVRLEVSRTAVREACSRLCVEGLINEGLKGGYFAANPGSAEIQDTLEIRIMLETGAIDRICRLGLTRAADLKPLADACAELEWLLHRGYVVELAESDRRFHEGLIAVAANTRLTRVYRCVPPADCTPETSDARQWASVGQAMLEEHKNIVSAIRKGRASKAQDLLREHLTSRPPSAVTSGKGVA